MHHTGSLAPNLHEGSRTEYLAQFAFSAFGTVIPVPHHEDTGLDLYCTVLERVGQRAWPRAYFSMQVKSGLTTWEFPSNDSVRWLIEHPLPIFLCCVEKSDLRLRVYPTTPRFAAWTHPTQPDYLEMIPEDENEAQISAWVDGNRFSLGAPILNFTIQEILDVAFRQNLAEVLKTWVDIDLENLSRKKNGIHQFRVPYSYKTNSSQFPGGWTQQGHGFREESIPIVKNRIEELLGLLATHEFRHGSCVSAAIYATALRQLDPTDWKPFAPHDPHLHNELNKAFGSATNFQFAAADSLLALLKDELAKHGISDPAA